MLAGDREWSSAAAQTLLSATPLREILWVGNDAPGDADALPPGKALSLLGREFDAVVYDARAGFDPDAFGAVAGTIRGGGLLLLTTPPLETWPDFPDPEYRRITVAPHRPEELTGRFLRRAVRIFRNSAEPTLIEQQGRDYTVRRGQTDRPARTPLDTPSPPYRTRDQQQAVETVIKVTTGQRRRPVVLTSDRGRGKSAALGLAAAQLMQGTARRILVTGPGVEAVEPLFRHARQQIENTHDGRGTLHCGAATLSFHPPDRILREQPQADLLLVDEAAAIPVPLLEQLLERYSRIAFATTVHGYEGTGRGFELRFRRMLDRKTRGWRALQMETPIRWAPNDPLERFTFRLLMLDAAVAPEAALRSIRPEACKIEKVDRDRLLEDENTLSELFGLLVVAHYRTRPYDLRHLLDGPNLSIYLMRYREHVVGAVLAAKEGGFDAETSRRIWAGERRPQGHLLPEALAAHLGLLEAPGMGCARILRIAIHPSIQRQGFGTRLLQTVTAQLEQEPFDYLGASFGATPQLIRFWHRCGYQPVRLGVKRGATSGAHSALVVRGVSQPGGGMAEQAHHRFIRTFPHQLSDPLRELETEMALTLLATAPSPLPLDLDQQDRQDLEAFTSGQRTYETVIEPLWKLTSTALTDPCTEGILEPEERAVLIRKVMQKQGWATAATSLAFGGRSQVTATLRRAARKLLQIFL